MTEDPKLSIIIPTRNGGYYLHAPIETILSQSYKDVELIVSVNHSEDNTYQVLEKYNDARLRIVSPPRLLSMTGHCEWCLKQARGIWLTIVGDDDGVMPYFFDEFEHILDRWKTKKVDAFCFRRAYYFWPGCEKVYGNSVLAYSGSKNECLWNGKRILSEAIVGTKNHFDLPQIYTNNIIRKELIESIREKSGGIFYHELNPDVYSGVAISLLANQIVRSELPMFWTGTSPKSVGIQTSLNSSVAATNQDTAKKDRAAEFFLTASNENIGVADEIGLIAWKTLKSSQLFVVSALFKVPFQLPYFFKSKKMILCLAITSTGLKSSKSFTDCQERNFLLDDIRKRNSLKLPMIIATTATIYFLRCLSFLDRSIEKLIYYIYRRNKTTTLRIVINQRNGLNNLLDAHQIVDDYNSWYRDKLDRD